MTNTLILFYCLLIVVSIARAQHNDTAEYDFIIVGSGSCGSVLANRLSEISKWNILLLEAGDPENFIADIPMLVSALAFSKWNWKYKMEYQENVAFGCKDNRMHWSRGKALGGTSVINYMIYSRGNKESYDLWGQSCPGWSYNEVLPYFIKSERNYQYQNNTFHGTTGELSVEEVYQKPISQAFIDGLQELGYSQIDYNSDQSLGVAKVQGTVKHGNRWSVAKAFLQPVRSRKNLRIITNAYVTKVLIDANTLKAQGVEFYQGRRKKTATASKEVILSAGTFNSAQLLMLAGIGPKEDLEKLGITVIKDAPVGQNLEDHLAYLGLSFSTKQKVTMSFWDFINPFSYVEYLLGNGPITSIGGVEAISYIKTNSSESGSRPDVEILFTGASLATDNGILSANSMGMKRKVYRALFGSLELKYSFLIMPFVLNPQSRGSVKLKSTNPFDYPLLYGNYYTDSDNKDLNTMLAAIRYVQRLAKTKAFTKFGSIFNTNRDPGCPDYEYDSDDYWKCCIRSLSLTQDHQIGTVKMGPKNDEGAVVDNRLKVYGIEGLRVADSSVVPNSLGAHMNAPAIMIGEKGADLIKEDWGEA